LKNPTFVSIMNTTRGHKRKPTKWLGPWGFKGPFKFLKDTPDEVPGAYMLKQHFGNCSKTLQKSVCPPDHPKEIAPSGNLSANKGGTAGRAGKGRSCPEGTAKSVKINDRLN